MAPSLSFDTYDRFNKKFNVEINHYVKYRMRDVRAKRRGERRMKRVLFCAMLPSRANETRKAERTCSITRWWWYREMSSSTLVDFFRRSVSGRYRERTHTQLRTSAARFDRDEKEKKENEKLENPPS